MIDRETVAKGIRILNRFRRVLAILLPLTVLFLPAETESICVPFWIVYLLGCGSIVAGDILARKWNLWDESTLKRNNISNWLFAAGVFSFLMLDLLLKNRPVLLFEGILLFSLELFGILFVRYITRTICEIRWGKFSGIRTTANKIAGYALMLFIPIIAIIDQLPNARIYNILGNKLFLTDIEYLITIVFFALYAVACIEELILVATMKQFDPFRKSIFSKKQRTVLDTPRAVKHEIIITPHKRNEVERSVGYAIDARNKRVDDTQLLTNLLE
jgi:hypothetical protein